MGNPYPPTDPSQGGYPQQPPQGYPPSQGYPQQQPSYGIPGQPQQGGGYPAYPQQGGFRPDGAPALPPIAPKRGNNRLLSIIITVVVIGLISGVGAIVGKLGKNASTAGSGAYSSQLIGSGCDKGAAHWQTTTDTNIQGTCQSDGYLVTQSGSYDKVGEVFFNGTSSRQTFPKSYEVQVDAVLKTGGGFTGAGLEVHTQNPNAGDLFTARANSEWTAFGSDSTGNFTNRLGIGFLSQATSTVHLDVQVVGSVMTFSINGTAVETVVDTKFTTTDGIGVALSNTRTTSPFSVLFSNFKYTPQNTVPLSDTDAAATATVQAATTHPYIAAVPGPGCDTGSAQWAAPSVFGDTGTTAKCVAGTLQMTEAASDPSIGRTRFYIQNGAFPLYYSASVLVNVSHLPGGGCGGMSIVPLGNNGDVAFFICSDGSWAILQFDSTGQPNVVSQGTLAVKTTYTMKVSVTSTGQSLAIDGKTLGAISTTTFGGTNSLSLDIFTAQNQSGTVNYKTFVFTPLTK